MRSDPRLYKTLGSSALLMTISNGYSLVENLCNSFRLPSLYIIQNLLLLLLLLLLIYYSFLLLVQILKLSIPISS